MKWPLFIRLYLSVAAACLCFLSACVGEEAPIGPEAPGQELTIYFNAPAAAPGTRALTGDQEAAIQTLDVLAFLSGPQTAEGDQTYACRWSPTESGNTDKFTYDASTGQGEITLTMPANDNNSYRLVVLANVSTEVAGYFSASTHAGEKRSVMLGKLVSAKSGLWPADGTSYLPMWGQTAAGTFAGLAKGTGASISLIRALAKVNVTNLAANFTLQDVYVFNRPTRGLISPLMTNWDAKNLHVTAPSVPSDGMDLTDLIGGGTPSASYTVTNNASSNEIYLYESQPTGNNYMKATCLVVGGLYNGTMNYYRIDFGEWDQKAAGSGDGSYDWDNPPGLDTTVTGGFVGSWKENPLLRNYLYDIHIVQVLDTGSTSPDVAAQTIHGNLVAESSTWDEDSKDVVLGDGNQYELNVTPRELYLYGTSDKATVKLTTDHNSLAWSVIYSTSGKIAVSPESGTGSATFTVSIDPSNTDASGTYYFRIRLNGTSISLPIKVNYVNMRPPTSISPATLADGIVGIAHAWVLSTDGDSPLSWSISSGSLPPGLGINAGTGAISGTPTAAGTYTFTVAVSNSAGSTSQAYTLTIGIIAVTISTDEQLPNGVVNASYSTTLSASGGSNITWKLASGSSMPGGLTLGTDGTISGTPTKAGDYSFTAIAGNTNGGSAQKTFRLTVVTRPSIITTSLPSGLYVGSAYSATIRATGSSPITLTATGLPSGLSFTDNGNGMATLSGTPTAAGSYSLVVTATNAAGSAYAATKTYTLTVVAPKMKLQSCGDQGINPTDLPSNNTIKASATTFPYLIGSFRTLYLQVSSITNADATKRYVVTYDKDEGGWLNIGALSASNGVIYDYDYSTGTKNIQYQVYMYYSSPLTTTPATVTFHLMVDTNGDGVGDGAEIDTQTVTITPP
ncbi:MAG: putative Ig domain-containing protein [Tannerella sp.]|jgi:hypothetical protein|nr:putative Ig domain-containing protein [Tannerella sp.]